MSSHIGITEKCQKEDSFQLNNSDNLSAKRFYEDGEIEADAEKKQNKFSSSFKRYSRYDLLSLRNGQLSTHYPHCALRPELQALSIWTCRLRCELQYLGLWKIPNTGNSYGNCSCNGIFQSYTCENGGQIYAPSSSPAKSSVGSQKYYVHSQQLQQQSQHTASSSPTLGSKRAVRSRERSLNYQRCINTELIRGTSPAGSSEQFTQHNLSQNTKASFIDHRSISSSHLMPAFAKRRMGHTNSTHNHVEVCSNFNNTNGGHNSESLSNDDCSENANQFDAALKSRKESMKNSNNQNDFQMYKMSGNSRPEKNSEHSDGSTGWMNEIKKINTDYSLSNSKANNPVSGGNKKLTYERRIGSGRLVPRDVNWEMRGSKKQIEKESNGAPLNSTNNNIEKEKDITSCDVDKLSTRNSSSNRFVDVQERRPYDRHMTNLDDISNSAGSSSKRYTAVAMRNEGNNFENFTGQRSMSFRRREYVDHRDFRNFRDPKESRETLEHKESKGSEHHYNNKDEPEWFSEGPTSQHETIELRGFEELDEPHTQISIHKYAKMERKNSESSLLSHNSSSNINLSTKENVDISSEIENKSFNNTNNLDKGSDYEKNNDVEKDPKNNDTFKESSDTEENITEAEQNSSKPEEINDGKWRPNATEVFFDNFLNIEALENSLIGNANDQTLSNNDLSVGGKSRFSRWFFNNSNNQNNNADYTNNPPTKDDPHRQSKDLNENEFNSFLTFLKCNNIPTPELPKGLPSNVSALSVEELEARMRKMDAGEKSVETENFQTFPQSVDINSQDVEAFKKLLEQLGKPRVDISTNVVLPNTSEHQLPLTNSVSVMHPNMSDISTNVVLPNTSEHQLPLTNSVSVMHPNMSALPSSGAVPQPALPNQDYMMKMMQQHHMHYQHQPQQQHLLHHQQNAVKIVVPHTHQRVPLMSPNRQSSDNLPLIPVPSHHHHLMPMLLGQSQKRLDVQHLIQSVVREELSRSFLEKELKNPNIPLYTKDIITTVLKETSRLNASSLSQTNFSTPETIIPANESTTDPGNLMQSLARGEVSLNHLEHELNKLNNFRMISESPSSIGALKEKSRCGTPSSAPLNIIPITTSAGAILPLSASQAVSAQQQQQQNSIITKENVGTLISDHQQAISSILRQHHSDDQSIHIPTQRELKMHTQAIMQNAIFKKKIEVEQNEQRRRQEMHKQHELESLNQQESSTTMTQQVHQQSSQNIILPTPLAFTPTSVLRKMTAEKDTTSQTTTMSSSSSQHVQQHAQQPSLKLKQNQQIHNQQPTYQHPNQPRMILGGGSFQYMHQQQHHILPSSNGSPQISPQQKAQIRNQPTAPLKWPLIANTSRDSNHSLLSNLNNKPIGRPILKGPGPMVPQGTHNPQCQNQSSLNQNSQSIQQINQMQKYPSIQHHQQQQPRQIVGQQFSSQMLQHQISSSQQNNMQHQQLLQQQRSVVMHRHQIQQNELGNHISLPPSAHPANNDNNSVPNLNYQRDGGLSPTSNQLAQWFSPELLAQASAGKLPLLNMNQALSLEEFERSIQHSSTAVHN